MECHDRESPDDKQWSKTYRELLSKVSACRTGNVHRVLRILNSVHRFSIERDYNGDFGD